jgi:hypothetical protein
MSETATYVCDYCGEQIELAVDASAGESQEFVEDCPVCCRPNIVHVDLFEDGEARAWAEREQD